MWAEALRCRLAKAEEALLKIRAAAISIVG